MGRLTHVLLRRSPADPTRHGVVGASVLSRKDHETRIVGQTTRGPVPQLIRATKRGARMSGPSASESGLGSGKEPVAHACGTERDRIGSVKGNDDSAH